MKEKMTPVLIAALIVFAFISGSLWTKVKDTEKKAEADKQEVEIPAQQQQEPEEPLVLGAEDQAEITNNATAIKGLETAKVTIVEFSEYQCPFCKRYVDETYDQILNTYGDQIRYIFRDYPLPFHQHSQITSEAARCAGDQGDYWSYHDKLFQTQDEWSAMEDATETLVSYATELGLNTTEFNNCLTSGKFTQQVKDDFSLGQKVGVSGTPSFFINGTQLVGAQPFENFEVLIEEELNK